ncbi:hypothetical protein GGI12_004715 [Dipsacomyces acuminosporus]|nr:hypothetical protein GGI12_004715 [Dipsacomyces acuminosporus]
MSSSLSPPYRPRHPEDIGMPEKKHMLHQLARRAKHQDRKWAVGLRKPDGFTILAILPVFGDVMTTSLASSYLRNIHSMFFLPRDIDRRLEQNICKHAMISAVPLVGWILRRVYRVNRRNYKATESKAKIESYLSHCMKVSCGDGRQFVGLFKCVDRYQNIILSDTTEHRKGKSR